MTALMIFELASVVLWDTECSTHLSVACFWKAKACCFALDVCSVSFFFLVPISPGIIPSLILAVSEIVNEVLTLPSSCRCMCLELSNLLCRP